MLPYQITKPMSWWYVSPRVPSMMAVLHRAAGRAAARQDGGGWPWLPVDRLRDHPAADAGAAVSRLQPSQRWHSCSSSSETPKGSNVLVVVRGMMRGPGSEELSGDPATSAPVYWHFSSWPMALHGGYDPYAFDQGIPISPRTKLQAPPWANTDTFELRQAPDVRLLHRAQSVGRHGARAVAEGAGATRRLGPVQTHPQDDRRAMRWRAAGLLATAGASGRVGRRRRPGDGCMVRLAAVPNRMVCEPRHGQLPGTCHRVRGRVALGSLLAAMGT